MALTAGQVAPTSCRLDRGRLDAFRLNAVLGPPTLPIYTYPANGFVGGPYQLLWTANGATAYDVYYGPTPTPPLVSINQPLASYQIGDPAGPPVLTPGLVYYWQIVAKNIYGTTAGPLWSFTAAAPGYAVTPTPENTATEISTATNLSWTAAPYAITYDVYVGTRTPPPTLAQAHSPELVYNPPRDLGPDTLYFWRIVARNNAGTSPGNVWSFTTGDPIRLIIRIDGVTPHMRITGLSIRDNLNDAPNTCTFVVDATPPHVGQVVQIGIGSLTGSDLIFAGTIQAVEKFSEGWPAHLAWRVSCIDWWQRLNRTKVLKHYDAQSATAIAIDLVTTYGLGFTTGGIAAGLPTVGGGIDFTHEDLGACLKRLMQRVGGYWYVDYAKVVHAFLTEATAPPAALVPATLLDDDEPPITHALDLSQIRTRTLVEGGGANATIDVPATDTLIPIEDHSWYAAAGGLVVTGTQRVPYTALVVGGGGSFVQGQTGPSGGAGTPTAALGSGAGGVLGNVNYKVTFRNAAGETLPGPVSNTVVGVAFASPSASFTASAAVGLGRLIGAYIYKVTFVTARGETDTGGGTASVTLVAWPVPGIPTLGTGGFGPLSGAYSYKVTNVTDYGETTAGAAQNYTATALAAPGAPGVSEVASTVGPLVGAYNYKVSFGTAFGETLPGTAAAITVSAHVPTAPSGTATGEGPLIGAYSYRVSFVSALGESLGSASGTLTATVVTPSAPTVSGDGTGVEIAYAVAYVHPVFGPSARSARTVDTNKGTNPVVTVVGLPSGCGWNVYSTGTVAGGTGGTAPMYRVAEMGVGVSSFTHTVETGPSDGGVLATMGRRVDLTSIPIGPTGTTARRIYRTKAGGSTYYLVGQLDNNTATSLTDTTPDAALTQTAPGTNPNGKPVALSGIPTGPTGTLVRRLYRTKAGGSAYFLIGQLDDNTTATHTDTTPDPSLTVPAPIVATAGGEAVTVSVPTGPTGTRARRLYRTTAGGATYRRVAELPDNSTTSHVDRQPDAALDAITEPVVHTAGGQNATLSFIPTGATGTTMRRIYRTKAGGTEYFLAGEIPNNSGSTYTDSALDGELGATAPTVNTAGASTVVLTAIPLGGASITGRRLYRRDSAGLYRRVVDLGDNTTATYTDATDEVDLGELAPTVSTIGALPGETAILLASVAGFPAAGWAKSGSQRFRYSGISGSSLTGIPASGVGALVAPLQAGDEVVLESMLVGVTLTAPIAAGDPVHVLAVVTDAAAQAELAALEGGDSTGIYEHAITDTRLTAAEATATATADLRLFARPIATLRYASRDRQTVSGKTVHVDLPSLGIAGDYLVQTVTIDQIGFTKGVLPRYTVEASSTRWTFEDLLRQLLVRP